MSNNSSSQYLQGLHKEEGNNASVQTPNPNDLVEISLAEQQEGNAEIPIENRLHVLLSQENTKRASISIIPSTGANSASLSRSSVDEEDFSILTRKMNKLGAGSDSTHSDVPSQSPASPLDNVDIEDNDPSSRLTTFRRLFLGIIGYTLVKNIVLLSLDKSTDTEDRRVCKNLYKLANEDFIEVTKELGKRRKYKRRFKFPDASDVSLEKEQGNLEHDRGALKKQIKAIDKDIVNTDAKILKRAVQLGISFSLIAVSAAAAATGVFLAPNHPAIELLNIISRSFSAAGGLYIFSQSNDEVVNSESNSGSIVGVQGGDIESGNVNARRVQIHSLLQFKKEKHPFLTSENPNVNSILAPTVTQEEVAQRKIDALTHALTLVQQNNEQSGSSSSHAARLNITKRHESRRVHRRTNSQPTISASLASGQR
ncbi:hypothetical protein [Rickettsiales endosymbiont of Stachyamoeba lipophora]|uniref:hypothetical protein n=1 Tax=Rickettsiales endosymbiont of Stachyamoeba lipophora TaxID=2486578 RepID=UPI000F64A1B2|nr:hypothetical protein [Rickettsiales endosymbiont of Stachyamoeba lipophora]AZL16318.1 hypothetical protein EF513_07245 [Rickettsiales endosymbiont of Stachyamoeba lipophora]